MPDTVHVTFLFALGAQVRWAHRRSGPWTIVQRQYLEVLASSYVRYRLALTDVTQAASGVLAYEPDLAPWES